MPSFPGASVEIEHSDSRLIFEMAYEQEESQSRITSVRRMRKPPNASELRELLSDFYVPSGPKELRQLVHSVRWQRKDPPTQLPPHGNVELTNSVTTGLSIEHSETLATSLGLDLGPQVPGLQTKLSYKVQEQFGLKLNITETEQNSKKLTLSNTSNDRYRLFAQWQVDHLLSVNVLNVPVAVNVSAEVQPVWRPCSQVQFMVANEPFVTSALARRQTKARG